jgi:hypothetical protein
VERYAWGVQGARQSRAFDLLVHLLVTVFKSDDLDDEELLTAVAQDEFPVAIVAETLGAALGHLPRRESAARQHR